MHKWSFADLLEKLPLLKRWKRHQRLSRMRNAILALSPLHHRVFRLIRFQGLSVAAAASELNLPPQQVQELLTEVIIALAEAARR